MRPENPGPAAVAPSARRSGTKRVIAAPYVVIGTSRSAGQNAVTSDGVSVIADGAIALYGDEILDVGERAQIESHYGRAEVVDAILLPALVNAHLHLELSALRGRVPGGEGLAKWIERLVRERRQLTPADESGAMAAATAELIQAGVAAVGEVTNSLHSVAHLADARRLGTIFHEIYGLSEERAETALQQARSQREALAPLPPGLSIAPSPHAVYSTHRSLIESLLRAGPSTIHLAEDRDERAFTLRGEGALRELEVNLGNAASHFERWDSSPVGGVAPYLHARALAVHAVDIDGSDIADLLHSRATVVLCPRSNAHITGKLPDLPRLLEAGIPLAIGTDSLASSPSLAPIAELLTLKRAYPFVAAGRLLALAWNGAAVGAPHVGRLAAGFAPGILAAPLAGERPRRPLEWLLESAPDRGAFFSWIAHPKVEIGRVES